MVKKTFFVGLFIFVFSLNFVNAQSKGGAIDDKPKGGAIDMSGEINGAPYRVVVPENWNGTLLLYAHGYRDRADHPGEVDNRNADVAPSAALEPVLLAQGYALAGSAYRNNGWAVEEGIQDMRNLALFFRFHVAQPDRTIMWAVSMGTVIGFKSAENFGDIYDGFLCACAVGAGTARSFDTSADLMLAYDTVFGILPAWGTVGDVRDDLDFETEVAPKIFAEVNNPANFPGYEFIRLVVGTPGRGITPPPPPAFYPGWVFTDVFFATEARAELERRAGGPIVQNLNRNYSLTPQETGYLMALGVPPAVINNWLAAMNGRRNISAPHFSRFYVEQYASYTGNILKPVLTMHTIIDPLVTVSQERAYADTVIATNHDIRLFQTYTDGNGHCNFTGPQLLTAVNAINSWVITGVRPTQANFPAAVGFLPNFTPPPLNQP